MGGSAREDVRRKERQKGRPSHVVPTPLCAGPCQGPRLARGTGPQRLGMQPRGRASSFRACHLSSPCFLSPDFQPKVQSRLVGGSGVCAGSVEVRHGKQWGALCDGPTAKGSARWQEVCREQQCGDVSAYRVLETSEKTSRGLYCPQEKLSQCHQLQEKKAHCKRVFVTCTLATALGWAEGSSGFSF